MNPFPQTTPICTNWWGEETLFEALLIVESQMPVQMLKCGTNKLT